MNQLPTFMSADHWVSHLFSSQAAREGGVIHRKVRDVERFVSRDAFLLEMKRRGFPVVENAGQFVIFCNREPIRRLVYAISSKKSRRTLQRVRTGVFENSGDTRRLRT